MLRAVLLLASLQRAIGSCIFCDATYSYDLSRLPTTTFTAHSGTRGSTTDPYRRYVVSSPCVTPQSDLCMTHPTSDPLQMRNKQGNVLYTICTGLGTLNATTRVTARGVGTRCATSFPGSPALIGSMVWLLCSPRLLTLARGCVGAGAVAGGRHFAGGATPPAAPLILVPHALGARIT